MSRIEHLNWAKKRALEYVKEGDTNNAFASMVSDLGKHPETRLDPVLFALGMEEIQRGPEAMRHWIEGFN